MKSIAVDMDGVLADIDSHYLNLYYKAYGVRVPYEQLLGKPEGEGFPVKEAIPKFVRTPGFFRSLPVMPGAVEAITELTKSFDIYVVSAAMEFPDSLMEKYEWLQQHFPFISWSNIIFCGDKSVIHTDYMIDDHTKNLDKFKGKTLMFHCAHNANVKHHRRVNSWAEVLDLLKHASQAAL